MSKITNCVDPFIPESMYNCILIHFCIFSGYSNTVQNCNKIQNSSEAIRQDKSRIYILMYNNK